MGETARGTVAAIWATIVLCVCIGIFVIFSTGLQAKLMPWWFAVERQAVEQSKSFVDSNTTQMINKINEWNTLDAKRVKALKAEDTETADMYRQQQVGIYTLVCATTNTMAEGTVSRTVRDFLSKNGNCLPN